MESFGNDSQNSNLSMQPPLLNSNIITTGVISGTEMPIMHLSSAPVIVGFSRSVWFLGSVLSFSFGYIVLSTR
jgi:hypothetical protein